jgi:hypothetical protein
MKEARDQRNDKRYNSPGSTGKERPEVKPRSLLFFKEQEQKRDCTGRLSRKNPSVKRG